MLIVSTSCKSSSPASFTHDRILNPTLLHDYSNLGRIDLDHHRQSRYAPRDPHVQASQPGNKTTRSRFCRRSYGSSSSSSSAACTSRCSNHIAWPKSTASRGPLSRRCLVRILLVLICLVRHADYLERHTHVPQWRHSIHDWSTRSCADERTWI
jgi:hypothetical protein